jgi:iron complex outermembrane receptor protein
VVVGGVKVPIAAFCPYETDKIHSSSFTPRVGFQYNIDSSMMVYFTYSKGYKAGGANIYSCHDDYTPEKITSYEIGYKSQWLDNSVTLNASAFHYDYSDFQVSQIVGLSLDVTNAAGAQVDGLELEGVWAPDNHWTLNANLSYINAYYTNFFNTDGLNPVAGLQDLQGNLLNDSPRVSANAGIAYSTDPFSWGHLTGMVNASYRSRTYFREFNALRDSQEPYGLVNLNLVWDSPDGKYQGRVYANNLLNQSYIQAMGDSTSIGTRYVTWGTPQQVGFELRVQLQ